MKLSNVVLLAVLEVSGALALPQPPGSPGQRLGNPKGGIRDPGNPQRSRCQADDTDIYTRKNWNDKNVDDWFNDWDKEYSTGDEFLYQTFSEYWGMGETFQCNLENTCSAGKCSELNRPQQSKDYERAHMVLTSMSNFNQYCNKLFQALNGANLDFATLQVRLQDTFYPSVKPSNFDGLAGLNALTAVVGVAAAWTGPLKMAVSTAGVNSVKEMVAAVSRGVSSKMTASDMSLATIASMEDDAQAFFNDALESLEKEHNGLLRWGAGYTGYAMLEGMFAGGAWVDRDNIPVLSGLEYGEVRNFFERMIYAMTINKAWKEQGVYIISRSMSKDDCLAWDPLPDNPKVCMDDRGFWLVKHRGSNFHHSTGVTVPPGASEMEAVVGFTPEDAMRSSIWAFESGGYNFKAETVLDDDLMMNPDDQELSEINAFRGLFDIPICYPESSGQFKDSDLFESSDPYWNSFMKNFPDKNQHAEQACLCSTAYDGWGVSILDIEDNGSNSFRALMEDAGECNWSSGIIDW